ncbi:MAG: MIP family channel protein [bacterium]|nr:MIP family channel protein [bacterium]MBK8130107.1 MIP family channel protein [bacterium]
MMFKKMLAEFVGTFALIFIGVGAIVSDHLTNGAVGLTGIALAHGLTIAIMAAATGAISGGHLNPAVSFGALLTGNMNAKEFAGYVAAQCLGAIAASSLLMSALPKLALDAVNYGIPAVGESATPGMAVIAEIVLTFILVYVIFGTAVDKRAPKMGGLFIGLAVTVDIFMGGPISGAAMNPARWLGPALLSGDFQNAWVYWVGPLAGGALGAVVYSSFQQEK